MTNDITNTFDLKKFEEKMTELRERRKECEPKGHPNAKRQSISQFRGIAKAHMYCSDCERFYDRNLTEKESDDWYKMINSPMTI